MDAKKPNIVVLGGGTGSFTVLSALKKYAVNLTAIVSMADDGGSTGVLRDELGTLPPGDIRQCLVALSEAPFMRDLFDYRFDEGSFAGHSFGNLFIVALEKSSGNFARAIEWASEILRIKGRVLPATLDNVRLLMKWPDAELELHGERVIDVEHFTLDPRKATLSLEPEAQINPDAARAIAEADLVILAPGDLYTSLGAILAIDGIGEALAATKAKVVYVCNLVTKHGQTDGFSVEDHVHEIERFIGEPALDVVLYNTEQPSTEVRERYHAEKAYIVSRRDNNSTGSLEYFGTELLGPMAKLKDTDKLLTSRSLIRHDYQRLSEAILQIGGLSNGS